MEPCPSCFQNVEILESHYGTLFNCPHCNAVFFVGWDGKPKASSHTANKTETPEASMSYEPQPQPAASQPTASQPPAYEAAFDSPLQPEENQTPMEVQAETGLEPTAPEPPITHQPVAPPPTPNQFQDVVDFGNSVNVEGTLSYTLRIQGIDHSSVLQQIKDLLDDSRLGWKIDDVLAEIQNGELVLPNLNPAKTAVIVQRLKHLPVRISWKQILATI